MFTLCFNHFQLMPEYLDFLIPFGERHRAEDFHTCGFRQRTHLADHGPGNAPHTAKNKQIQMCYSLKSVEPSDSDEWSIRQCAIHHVFNLTEVGTSWTIVKGNDLMKRRIQSATEDCGTHKAEDFQALDRAFETSFKTHLIFCDWSAEYWRWYVNWLEESFEDRTWKAFSAPIPREPLQRMSRNNTHETGKSKTSVMSRILSPLSNRFPPNNVALHQEPAPKTYTNPETGYIQPLPPDEDNYKDDDKLKEQSKTSNKNNDNCVDEENRDFSFSKLRRVYEIGGKANEASLVLKQNVLVLSQLRDYYNTISKRKSFPVAIAASCRDVIDDFGFRLEGIVTDMQAQVLRLETLLNLIDDRKTLVEKQKEPSASNHTS